MRAPNKRPRPNAKFIPSVMYRDNKKAYMNEYMKWYTKNEMNRLRSLRNNKCELCSSQLQLQFAHLKPTKLKGGGRGKYSRVRDIKANPKKYALLCFDCHKTMDTEAGTWCNKHNYKS